MSASYPSIVDNSMTRASAGCQEGIIDRCRMREAGIAAAIFLGTNIFSFVASHLELKNTLGRAKEELAAAAKMAQDEARNKSKTAKKAAPADVPVRKDEQKVAESPKAPSLFDMPAPVVARPTPPADSDEEAEIVAEMNQEEETED